MRTFLNLFVTALLAAVFSLPGVSGGGGPGGGSTGVWVLPLSTLLGSGPLGAPRDVHTGVSTDEPLALKTSGEGDGLVAVLTDDLAAEPIALPVAGDTVTIPAAVLRALAQRPGARADVVIADAELRGYVLRIAIGNDGRATVRVY